MRPSIPRPAHGFESVDDEDDARWCLDCLDTQCAQSFHQAVRRSVFALFGLRPGFGALDIGCGTGEDARALAQLVGAEGQVVGVDASATMITEARERSAGTNRPVAFEHADAARLDFANAGFDGWIAHHIPALMAACGLTDVTATAMTQVRTDYAEVEATSHYEGGIQVAQSEGIFTAEEAALLTEALRAAAQSGHFFAATTFFFVGGTKP